MPAIGSWRRASDTGNSSGCQKASALVGPGDGANFTPLLDVGPCVADLPTGHPDESWALPEVPQLSTLLLGDTCEGTELVVSGQTGGRIPLSCSYQNDVLCYQDRAVRNIIHRHGCDMSI